MFNKRKIAEFIEAAQKNIRKRNFQQKRIKVKRDRIQVSMIEAANKALWANIFSACASGIKTTGSLTLVNEGIIDDLNFNRNAVFTAAQIEAKELERQNEAAREHIKKREASLVGKPGFLVIALAAGVLGIVVWLALN